MTRVRLRRLAGLALVAACGGSKPPATSAASESAVAAAAGSGSAAPGSAATVDAKGCLHDGRWRPCGLVDRLEKAGLVVQPEADTARYEFLSAPGLRYTVGRGEVQAFFYDDTTRLARDVAALDTVRVAPAGSFRHWDVRPTFIRSGNLVVILLSLSETLVERVQFAVQAGAPQPEPPPGDPVAVPLAPTRVP